MKELKILSAQVGLVCGKNVKKSLKTYVMRDLLLKVTCRCIALVKQDKMLVAYKCFERHTLQKVARKEINKNVFFSLFQRL